MSSRYLGCQTFSPQAGSPRANSPFLSFKAFVGNKINNFKKVIRNKVQNFGLLPGEGDKYYLIVQRSHLQEKRILNRVRRDQHDQVQVPLSRVYKNENYLKNDLYLVIMFV